MTKLDVATMEHVRTLLVDFAQREWKSGTHERSDVVTEFISDLDKLIARTREDQKAEFQSVMNDVQESLRLIALNYCLGCTVLITEGSHSYSKAVPASADGTCSKCFRKRPKSKQ